MRVEREVLCSWKEGEPDPFSSEGVSLKKEVYGLRGGYSKGFKVRYDVLGFAWSEKECREEECSEKWGVNLTSSSPTKWNQRFMVYDIIFFL